VISGFTTDSDVDLVAVWQTLPDRAVIQGATRVVLDDLVLEKARCVNHDLDVMHLPLSGFSSSVDAVETGRTWRSSAWPDPCMPLPASLMGSWFTIRAVKPHGCSRACPSLRRCSSRPLEYVLVFAVAGHYCPFPKHLSAWLDRLGIEPSLVALDRDVWGAPTPEAQTQAAEDLAIALLDTRDGVRGDFHGAAGGSSPDAFGPFTGRPGGAPSAGR
jgi:hypothetical protein